MSATAEALYHRHRLSADDDERMGQARDLSAFRPLCLPDALLDLSGLF
ncbi:MAG: hypothetical protein VBE63_28260 [Lamprobacter sp.]|nr:hypothetical protein [Lamprobacter sp.]MEA3643791.1 hypothetical protein [Lamprobacter sp.]